MNRPGRDDTTDSRTQSSLPSRDGRSGFDSSDLDSLEGEGADKGQRRAETAPEARSCAANGGAEVWRKSRQLAFTSQVRPTSSIPSPSWRSST